MPRFTSDLVAEQRDPDADDTNVIRPRWQRQPVNLDDVLVQFRRDAAAGGVVLPPEIEADGELHRADSVGRNGSGDSSYILHMDGSVPAGGFQDWQSGRGWANWRADIGRTLTPAEDAELRQKAHADKMKRKAERDKRAADAREKAGAMWDAGRIDADEHPYVMRKNIKPHGARRQNHSNNLLIPMLDENDELVNLQLVDPNGAKRFLSGGIKRGCSFQIGELTVDGYILFAEGYATGASLHQATDYPAITCFDAGNMVEVARIYRARYPDAVLVFCADDDAETAGNPGITAARAAAAETRGIVVVPEFGPNRPKKMSDFNDLHVLWGLAEVARQIEVALAAEPKGGAAPEGGRADQDETQRPAGAALPDGLIIEPSNPYANAKDFIGHIYTEAGHRILQRHRGTFYQWIDGSYREITAEDIRSKLYDYLAKCRRRDPDDPKRIVSVRPNQRMVGDHVDALRAVSHLNDTIETPAWLSEEPTDMPADEMVSLQNGLLHLPSKSLLKHTPAFFTYNTLPFDYQPGAQAPQWLKFLEQLWPNDQESIDTLQEIFGLCLTKNTEFQKIFLVLGPRRCGKGTIGRILRAMLGTQNVISPTLASLSTEFGMQQLIGMLAAIISDARLSAKTDSDSVAERLLNISGEDAVSVNRKFGGYWNGHLQVRVIMLANGPPRFTDASGAFAGRFIILRIVPSFYGKEDRKLTEKLKTELPGILNWSIAGWEQIAERGHFIQPESGEDDMRTMEDMASPIGAFIREKCVIGVDKKVVKKLLYRAWCTWCGEQGRQGAGNNLTFGKALKEALPQLGEERPRTGEAERPEYYTNIALKGPAAESGDPNRSDRPYWDR